MKNLPISNLHIEMLREIKRQYRPKINMENKMCEEIIEQFYRATIKR